MKFHRIYCCSTCRVSLEHHNTAPAHERLTYGSLICPSCSIATPVIAGFPLFGESFLCADPPDLNTLMSWEERLFGDSDRYARFVQSKRRRPTFDAYAYFRPFNESTRALFPLLEALEETLEPGDVILDTWCRTGWTGEMLAAFFPEQQIVSLWEGNSNVLGYKGFRYWLGESQRAPNLEIAFAHPNRPLPFANDSIGLLHGLDSLHRYDHQPFLGECLRVTGNDRALVFPHNHLTNSEPEPFFERGCNQYHGTFWRDVLDRALAPSGRRAFVMPEVELFAAGDSPVVIGDLADTEHFNALILLADASWDQRFVTGPSGPKHNPEAYAVINPLFTVDPSTGAVAIDREALGGSVEYVLSRHPIYEDLYAQIDGLELSSFACQCMYWAERGLRVREIAERVTASVATVQQELALLEAHDLVQVIRVSPAMQRLQHFYARQEAEVPNTSVSFGVRWLSVTATARC